MDIIHPDLATSGGILETKKIGDMAQEYGVPMAMHFAGTPGLVHGERALRRGDGKLPGAGKPLGRHALVGRPGGRREKPIVNKGFAKVPEAPGLGVTLNDEVVKAAPRPEDKGYFEPTPQWDRDRVNDRQWS